MGRLWGRSRRLAGGLHADKRRGGKQRHWNEQHCEKRTATSARKSLAESAVVEQPLNAAREITSASHGDSYEGWARCSREFKKYLSVSRTAGSLLQSRAIADGLGQIGEFAFEPPSQRTKPEESGIDARKRLQIKVALPNVRAFVS